MSSTDWQIAIRDYRRSDRDVVADVWLRSWQSTGIDVPVALNELRSRLPEGLTRGWIVHVATIDGEIVGFVALCTGKLEQLCVAPEWQRRGVGKLPS